jgi:hypothetical protein
MKNSIKFEDLEKTDLILDCNYESSRKLGSSISSEPLSKLLNVSNQGGFRYRGSSSLTNFL